jgi:hypothetical protein
VSVRSGRLCPAPWDAAGAELFLRHQRDARFAAVAAVPLAVGAFWSPLGAFGAAVLTAVALLQGGGAVAALRAAVAPANLLAAAFAAPLCLYLLTGSAAIPQHPLLRQNPEAWAAGRWLLFLTVEVLCWAGFAAMLVHGRLFAAAVVLLCLLPGYLFGPGNEMAMRGGVAPLAVVAVTAAAALLAPAAGRPARRIGRAGLVACAVLAATGSAMEASLLVTHAPWPASRDCSLPEAARQSVFTGATDCSHYVVRWPDASLRAWLADPAPRRLEREALSRCWVGRRLTTVRGGQEPRRP